MNKINKIVLSIVIAISSIALVMPINQINATTFSVSASTSSVNANGSFTFYVGGSVTGRFNISASNGSVSTSSVWVENNTQAITVTAGNSGTVTVSATAVDVSDASYNAVTGTQSVNVSIVSNSGGGSSTSGGGSSNNNNTTHYVYNPETGENEEVADDESTTDLSLKSLSISNGTLSPEFNTETINYIVELTSDIKKVTIKAEANSNDVTVEGIGDHNLNEGENSIDIKVSDGQGNSKVYNIKFNVEAKPSIYLEGVNHDKLGILTLNTAPPLTNFEEYKFKINGKEVIGKKNSLNKLVVLYMLEENNSRNYYIYDEKKKKITSIYKPVSLLGKNYAVVTIPEKYKNMDGYIFGNIKVDGQSFNGWVFKNKKYKNYNLLYLMDENAKTSLYQYEKESNTLQPFSGVAPIDQEEYDSLKNKETIMYGLLIVCGIVTVCLIIFLIMFIKMKKGLNKKTKIKK